MRPRRSLITRRLPGFAGELVVEREFERFLALVVDVGETDQMRDVLAARVVAAVFALQEYRRVR